MPHRHISGHFRDSLDSQSITRLTDKTKSQENTQLNKQTTIHNKQTTSILSPLTT